MILTNPYSITYDNNIEYHVTPIMKKWYENKTPLRIVKHLQHCIIVGDGINTQIIKANMLQQED